MIASPIRLSDSLLVDIRTYDVFDSALTDGDDSYATHLAAKSVATGVAELLPGDHGIEGIGSAIAIPLYCSSSVRSVAVLAIASKDIGAGVFEIWEPVGVYSEVKLRAGYFANLERFSNVSSFVRFEKGSGLPGQAWSAAKSVIHDDLPNHPGFLRAAGASAGLLNTALAIPVICEGRLMSVVALISSAATPIAKGYEIWTVTDEGFVLDSVAYQGLPDSSRLRLKTVVDSGDGLPGFATGCGGVACTDETNLLRAGRESSESPISGALVIPFYLDEAVTSVTVLLF